MWCGSIMCALIEMPCGWRRPSWALADRASCVILGRCFRTGAKWVERWTGQPGGGGLETAIREEKEVTPGERMPLLVDDVGVFQEPLEDGVEILVLAWLVYYGYLLLKTARGARILLGLVMAMLGLILVSAVFKLEVLLLVISYLFGFVGLALVVVFQPEMRRAVVELGSRRFWRLKGASNELVELLCDSMQQLANRRFGAIFAINRDMDLADHAQTGVVLDANLSPELIMTIFHPKTALHDGGMILKEGRIHSAGCVFPISHREFSDRAIGLRGDGRHRPRSLRGNWPVFDLPRGELGARPHDEKIEAPAP